MISSLPALLALDTAPGERLPSLLTYLRHIGLDRQAVGSMALQFPMLLRYNPDVLRPKWRFFSRVMQADVSHLVAFPRYSGALAC